MATHESVQTARDELIAARDKARLKLHLLSRDTKDKWDELESQIESVEQALKTRGGKMPKQTWQKLQETRDAVRGFVAKHLKRAPMPSDRVGDLMTTQVYACGPDDELQRAADIMWNHDCGAVPVVQDGGRLVGIITDRDLCMAAYTRGSSLTGVKVAAAMAHDVATCTPEDTIAHAFELMAQRRVRRIPVVDADGHLTGMLSIGGLATRLAGPGTERDSCELLAKTLAAISTPWKQEAEQAAQ